MGVMDTTRQIAMRRSFRICLAAGVVVVTAAAAGAAESRSVTHELPELKRSYEVLLPPVAAAGSPLVVFLHGSGKPDLDRFKAEYGPLLTGRKCIVALPKAENNVKWRYEDAKYIVAAIEDAASRYKTDPKRVLLMGVSGGGQTALFLVDHDPKRYRAVIAVSTSPVVIRERDYEWFYPSALTAKTCPYFVVNHITQGASLQYWRQVRAAREGLGASVSILPVVGPVSHYLPPPKQLGGWLDDVLADKHPAAVPDPQKAAVAKMFAAVAAALPKAVAAAKPAAETKAVAKDAATARLRISVGKQFERSKKEDTADSAKNPIIQIRVEHTQSPIYVRCELRKRREPMSEVLAAEEKATRGRGMLYQIYHTGRVEAGRRQWQLKIGSITYPDRTRGWVSTLFLHASAPVRSKPNQWLEATVMDETQEPDAAGLAGILRTLLETIDVERAPVAGGAAPGP